MTLGRRYELLCANAGHNIPLARRNELLAELGEWIESEECSAKNPEELFWVLGASAAIHIGEYCRQVQAEIGAEILEKELRT